MKNFKKLVAALMACVAVATVTSGCNPYNPRDSYAAEVAFGLIPAEAEARNDLDEGYERIKTHPEELNATRTELENALKELEAVRAELEATREELEAVRADLEATREELANYQKKLE